MILTFIIVTSISGVVINYMNVEYKKVISKLNDRLEIETSTVIYYEEALTEISKEHEGLVNEAFAAIK